VVKLNSNQEEEEEIREMKEEETKGDVNTKVK
jgi:hypothetical protein